MSALGCVFCDIVAGRAPRPADYVPVTDLTVAFTPLNPVVPGHRLLVPYRHVADAAADPDITAEVFYAAAELAKSVRPGLDSNLLTSIGRNATQSVFHLHVHFVPRLAGDRLMLPWGSTGDPHAPHSCARSLDAEAELRELRHRLAGLEK